MPGGPHFSHPPITDDGRAEWEQKPRVPALHEALTDNPIVRFIGTDDPAVTAAGIANWQPIVTDWLREGRTPTVLFHTPDNAGAPAQALLFHEALSATVHGLPTAPHTVATPHPRATIAVLGGPEVGRAQDATRAVWATLRSCEWVLAPRGGSTHSYGGEALAPVARHSHRSRGTRIGREALAPAARHSHWSRGTRTGGVALAPG